MSNDERYYNLHELLSRNAQFNFIVGMRGNGKTFAGKDWAIRDFLKTGAEFIYLRRYKTELAERFSFFNDIAWKFPEYEFKVEGSKAYLRTGNLDDEGENKAEWRLFGYFVQLSTAVTKKSTPYPKVNKIIFDEFILDKGYIRYLPAEVASFQDFYNTVDRWKDQVRVLFMANSISIMNPYFLSYNIRPKKDREFTMLADGFICVQYVKTEVFQAGVKGTRFARMLSNTPYYSYAVENIFRDDNNHFVKKKSPVAKFHYALTFDDTTIGVWVDYQAGEYFISERYVEDSDMIFVLTKRDMQPNLLMIEKSNPLITRLKRLYMQGSVYFDSPRTREFMNDVFNFLNMK